MKKFPAIKVMSAMEALEYVYFYSDKPQGQKYAIISIQNPTRGYGSGLAFKKGGNCLAALNIEFSDASSPAIQMTDSVLIKNEDAWTIHDFVENLPSRVELLIIHCTKGVSRSTAVAEALILVKTGSAGKFNSPNRYVYYKILETYGLANEYWEKGYEKEKAMKEQTMMEQDLFDKVSDKLKKLDLFDETEM